MALFGKGEERPMRIDEPVRAPAVTPAAESRASGGAGVEVQAHLGRGSRIDGKLHFDGSVHIDGQVEGEIEAKDTVIIGESASVVAQIVAGTVIIKGKVTGDVTARKRIELRAPGRLLGNIVTPCLVIQEGVVFEGHCSMAEADVRGERGEKKVAIFPTEERGGARAVGDGAK